MRYFHKQQNHFWKPVINLDKVHISQLSEFFLADSRTKTLLRYDAFAAD